MLRKIVWFGGLLIAVIAVASVALAALEPGNTNSAELGRAVGRLIIPILLVTTALYFGAKRLGWVEKRVVTR